MWKKLSSSCQFYNFYLAQVYTKVGIQGVLGLGSKFIEIQVDVIFIPSFRRIKPLHRPVALIRDPRARSRTHLDELFYQWHWTIGLGGYGYEVHPPQICKCRYKTRSKGFHHFTRFQWYRSSWGSSFRHITALRHFKICVLAFQNVLTFENPFRWRLVTNRQKM